MRVVYSDESGCGSIKKEPLTVVTAIVLNLDRQWRNVETELALAKMGTPRNLLDDKLIFKGSKLYGAVKKNIPHAEETLRTLLDIPVRNKLPIFFGAVDRAGCVLTPGVKGKSPITEYRAAFDHCLADVDRAATTFAAGERVLWIAEQSDVQRESASRSGHQFHSLMKGIGFEGGKVVPTGDESTVVDTIYFGTKQHSIALQLADVCCSTVTLHLLEKYYDWKKTGVAPFYDLIRCNISTAEKEPEFFGYDRIRDD